MAISWIGGTNGNAANAGAITLTLPGGMAVDDLIVVAYGIGDDDFTQPTLAMNTAGYTAFRSPSTISQDGGTLGDGCLAVFYKFHNGTDTNAVTVASGAGTDSSCAAALLVFRGVATVAQGGPTEIAIVTAGGTSGGDPDPGQVSTFTEATSAVVIAGQVANATTPLNLTAPTGYTTNAQNGKGTDSFACSTLLAYNLAPSDPENPGIIADDGAGAGWVAFTIVLKAAPPAGATSLIYDTGIPTAMIGR